MTSLEFIVVFLLGAVFAFLVSAETATHGMDAGEWVIHVAATCFGVLAVSLTWLYLEPLVRW